MGGTILNWKVWYRAPRHIVQFDDDPAQAQARTFGLSVERSDPLTHRSASGRKISLIQNKSGSGAKTYRGLKQTTVWRSMDLTGGSGLRDSRSICILICHVNRCVYQRYPVRFFSIISVFIGGVHSLRPCFIRFASITTSPAAFIKELSFSNQH